MADEFTLPTAEQIQQGLAFYRLIHAAEDDQLALKLIVGDEGDPPCYWLPDPKGNKLLLPLSLRTSNRLRRLDHGGGCYNMARCWLGTRADAYRPRVVVKADGEGVILHVPTDPGVERWVLWYDEAVVEAEFQRKMAEA